MRRSLFLFVITCHAGTAGALVAQDNLGPQVTPFVSVLAPVVALRDVRLIDGTGRPAITGATILIRDGRIVAVGPNETVNVPDGADVHTLTGHTVIPGIVGLHNHTYYAFARFIQQAFSAPRMYLAAGVTTIRTTGSTSPYLDLNLKHSIDVGAVPGPRMFSTGPYINGTSGSAEMYLVSDPEDARRVVRYWAEEGVRWFKAYANISRAELGAAIDEAHRLGVKVTGHLCSVTFAEAVELGIDNLEHGFLSPMSDFDVSKEPDQCPPGVMQSLVEVDLDDPRISALFEQMVERGVAMTSTLAVMELGIRPTEPDPRVKEVLNESLFEEYDRLNDMISRSSSNLPGPELMAKAQAFERAFVDAGGLLAAGVDPGGPNLHGFGDQRNYELLREAGFDAEVAVQIMTLNGARVLEIEDDLGSVEPGKIADLVVLEGDLTARPEVIRNVMLVFKNGVGFDSAKLLESVRGQVGIR